MPYTGMKRERGEAAVRLEMIVAVMLALPGLASGAEAPSSSDRADAAHGIAGPSAPAGRLDLVGQLGGYTADGVVVGVHAWIGIGPRIVAFDVADPSAPRRLGESPVLSGVVQDIAIAEDRLPVRTAFVVTGEGGIEIVDIAAPSSPRRLGYLAVPDGATAITARDDHVYAAVGGEPPGVWVVDVADPAAPRVAGIIPLPSDAIGLAVLERRLHVMVDDEGLRIYDVARASAPALIGRAPTPDRESGLGGFIHIASSFALVADGPNGLRIFDVVDPARPREVGRLAEVSDARSVAFADGLAYVADGARGLAVVDVSTPRRPRLVGRVATEGVAASVDVDADHEHVLVTDERGVRMVDVSRPDIPRREADIDPPGYIVGVASEADRLFAFDVTHGRLWSMWADGRTEPRSVATDVTGQDGGALSAWGGRVYVAGGGEGLGVVDVSDPDRPAAVGVITATTAMDVHAVAGHLYVAAGLDGLTIMELADPDRPRAVGSRSTDGFATSVFAQIGRALVMGGDLEIVDTRDPAQPGPPVTFAVEGDLPGVVSANGERAYLATDRLHVVDLAPPSGPKRVATWAPGGMDLVSARVAVGSANAYVSDGFSGTFWALDVATDGTPREVAQGRLPAGSQALDMTVATVDDADLVLIASGDGGLTLWGYRPLPAVAAAIHLPALYNR